MRSFLIQVAILASGISLALAWAGLVCLNSGEPDFTEQFWFYGLVAFLASHVCVIGAFHFPKQEVVR
jgi:hypothetical protein